MATSRNDLSRWLHEGKERGATHMIVVADTFEWEDYPRFVLPHEDVDKVAETVNGPNMTKVIEVYNLSDDWNEQLDQRRCLNY